MPFDLSFSNKYFSAKIAFETLVCLLMHLMIYILGAHSFRVKWCHHTMAFVANLARSSSPMIDGLSNTRVGLDELGRLIDDDIDLDSDLGVVLVSFEVEKTNHGLRF